MGAFGKYCKNQLQANKLSLEHDNSADFCVGCWQRNRSVVPLLCIRTLIFAASLAITITSMVIIGGSMNFGYWFIYLTHWGVLLITITSGFAFVVSCLAYIKGPIDCTFGLPWYVKAYWLLYEITVPLALFITLFYYTLLVGIVEIEMEMDPVLDFFVHGMNSILMILMLFTSKHPCHVLHFIYPVVMALVYLAFNLIYYFAGGTDPLGNPWIYPVLDWNEPGVAAVIVVISALVIIIMHIIVVAFTAGREALTRQYRRDSKSVTIS